MGIKINKLTLLFSLLIFAIANASLRFSSDGMTSLFRLLSPPVVFLIYVHKETRLTKSVLIMLSGILYSIFVSWINYGTIKVDYLFFATYTFFVFVIVFEIRESVCNFEDYFWKFLHITTVITLILSLIQFFVRIPYPYVHLPSHRGVNLFMSNENELALPLGIMSLLYLYRFLFKGYKQGILWVAAILALIYINDAKLTLIGCLLGYAVLFLLKITRHKISASVLIVTLSIIAALALAYFYLLNPTVTFRDYSIDMKELVFSSIEYILKLEPMPGAGGSTIDRTNAIVFGLKELINSRFLGIGWGNSVTMLEMPQYQLLTAKSMHNIIFQFLCEMGLFAVGVYLVIIKNLIRSIRNLNNDTNCILKFAFIVAFFVMSAQSSLGILSNYYMWIIVFYIAFLSNGNNVESVQTLTVPNKLHVSE